MKEETKKKLCKISKIVGFAITFGFAVFGVLCAAMLISNGGKKDDIKTLDNSLVLNVDRAERIIKPRKAPDFEKSVNLLDGASYFDGAILNSSGSVFSRSNGLIKFVQLPAGYYYFHSPQPGWSFQTSFGNSLFRNELGSIVDDVISTSGTYVLSEEEKTTYGFSNGGSWSRRYFYNSQEQWFFVSANAGSFPGLYLVDTLALPSTSSVYLGENWNPLKAFGDSLSENGGYLLTDETWTANTQTFKVLAISGLLFRYEGVVYDRITMYARPLNALAYPYVDSSGAIIERAITQNSGPNEIYVLDYVGFSQSWKQFSIINVMVGGKADTPSPSGKLPYNGSLQWVTSSRTIEIIDNQGTTTGRWDNRFSNMTDLEFITMLSEYDSEGVDVVNGGQMFGLFTNAFDALTPILSIAILPNITLGMILFIPLVGGIIVVIIRLVKK